LCNRDIEREIVKEKGKGGREREGGFNIGRKMCSVQKFEIKKCQTERKALRGWMERDGRGGKKGGDRLKKGSPKILF
jgi:hypothetical protein